MEFLRNNYDKIIIALDNDTAGEKGTVSLIETHHDFPKLFVLKYPTDDPGQLLPKMPINVELAPSHSPKKFAFRK